MIYLRFKTYVGITELVSISSLFRRQQQRVVDESGCAFGLIRQTAAAREKAARVVLSCLPSTRYTALRTAVPRIHWSGKREACDSNMTTLAPDRDRRFYSIESIREKN